MKDAGMMDRKKLCYETIRFVKEKDIIKGVFMNQYYFYLDKDFSYDCDVVDGCLVIDKENKEKRAINMIENSLMKLRMIVDDKYTFYIHKGIINEFDGEGIPLIGANFVGIVDRGTNIIEVKPNTGCNINCIFCSVDEGKVSKKRYHYVAESDYLFEWIKKIVKIKENDVSVYINPHGEPLMYYDLERLIGMIASIDKIKDIAVITNGVLLTKDKVDSLVDAGCTQLNISLNAIDKNVADKVAGSNYPVDRILDVIKYAIRKSNVIISPVFMMGINDREIEKIVAFVSEMKSKINHGNLIERSIKNNINSVNISMGIQNFLPYKRGRNPVKQLNFDKFNTILKGWEERYNIRLINPEYNIKIIDDNSIEKIYKVGDRVKVKVLWHGRYDNEFLAYNKRLITIRERGLKIGKEYVVKIIKNKDNIYYGVL